MFYDDWTTYIWDEYAKDGYATFYAEDRPDISNFNYKGYLYGFKYKPTTHYQRPYWDAIWWNTLHRRSSAFCYDTIAEHKLQLDYLEQFVQRYGEKRLRAFSLWWTQGLSHDLLNKVGVADEDFREFFEKVEPSLNESIVFVLSDHGHRYASIRESVIGRLEARMPFLAVIVPRWLKKRYPLLEEGMRINSDRLTTPFDVYETLKAVLKADFGKLSMGKREKKRGYSLFEPVPKDRTCYDANVPDEFCPCYQEISLKLDNEAVKKAAGALLKHVNKLVTKEGPKCAVLSLKRITDAFVFLPHAKTLCDPQTGGRIPTSGFHVNYRVTVEVAPNDALLEAVVTHSLDRGVFRIDGDIERNNKYGNTSECVADRQLRKLCYCV